MRIEALGCRPPTPPLSLSLSLSLSLCASLSLSLSLSLCLCLSLSYSLSCPSFSPKPSLFCLYLSRYELCTSLSRFLAFLYHVTTCTLFMEQLLSICPSPTSLHIHFYRPAILLFLFLSLSIYRSPHLSLSLFFLSLDLPLSDHCLFQVSKVTSAN